MAGQHAVANDLVANLDRGAGAADFYRGANPFVARGVWRDVIAALCGQAFKALHVGLADAAGFQLDQDLVRLQRRQLQLFDAQVERAMHKGCFTLGRTIHSKYLPSVLMFGEPGGAVFTPPEHAQFSDQ